MAKGGHLLYLIVPIVLGIFFFSSCSTTRVVPQGSYRLKENKVTITNTLEFPTYSVSDIQSYIRQKPNTYFVFGWNPFLYIYNWSNGKERFWDRFVRKIGQAPVIFDPKMVDDSKTNMLTHLDFLGYYNSKVADSIVAEKKLASVFYDVTLGKQIPITEIVYIIKDSLLREKYFADTVNSFIKVGLPLSEQLLDKESTRAASAFRNDGYYGFTKNYFFFKADTLSTPGEAKLEVTIDNYTRNELPRDAKPHKQFYIGDVTIYPVSDVIRYRATLARRGTQLLDTLKFEDLIILYDKKLKIRPNVLARMNRVQPGSIYEEDIVNNTYQRLSNLRLFSSVNVSLDQVAIDTVDCNIRLIPSKSQGYKLNLEASINSTGLLGISPAISYYHRNIFRGGEWLNLNFMGNFQVAINNRSTRSNELGASASISFPTFLFLPDKIFKKTLPRTDLTASYNFQQRPEYTRNMLGGSFGYTWNNTSKNFFYRVYPIQMNIIKMYNLSPDFYKTLKDPFIQDSYKDQFDFGAGGSFSYSSNTTMNANVSNFKANLTLDLAGNLISAFNKVMPTDTLGKHTVWGSPYAQYARGELSLVYTYCFGKDKKQALAARFMTGLGYAYGNSTAMPFERLFWAGGSNSLRAWKARSVGPGSMPIDTTFSIPNQNGDFKLEANIEYRFPLFSVFRGAIFFDAGNVWTLRENSNDSGGNGQFHINDFYKTIALNTGVGIRLDIKFVVIRLDMGIKLHDPSTFMWRGVDKWFKKDGYAVQFAIGYPF